GINFEETWYIGDTIHVRWAGWNSTFTSDLMDNTTEAQLYVVAWNPDYSSYSSLLSSKRDISTDGSYDWTVNIDDKYLLETKEYSFTFVPQGKQFEPHGPHISSPGFSVKSKSMINSATSTISSTPTAVPNSSSKTASPGTDGLSTGAKAGIGIGAGIGGLALLTALGFYFYRRGKKASSREMTGIPKASDLGSTQTPNSYSKEPKPAPQELFVSPAELASTRGGR
ncbi:hypothetical protein N7475_006242, partial [Penicillium sp. IBT 31633x]